MQSPRYSKKISCEPWKKYFAMDENWELNPVDIESTRTNKFISHKSKFMKVFIETIPILIEKTKDLYKYVSLLQSCIWYENQVDMLEFREKTWLETPQSFSRVKSRLIDMWIIAKNGIRYYYNPAIAIKSDKIDVDLWNLFAEKNKAIYNIDKI